jgi:23S rRNA (adenine2503-C2)-methyltransferase
MSDQVASILKAWGEPAYRLKQVEDARRSGAREWDEVTTLPKDLRLRLAEVVPLWTVTPDAMAESRDGTIKWRLRTADGLAIESVLIKHARGRRTLCVSSQAGCALGCRFCATGAMGAGRDLTAREIADQALLAADTAREADARLSNIVFMGMGEPLANEASMWAAIERIHGDIGISARHITVSTVGIVPGIKTLTSRPLPVNLAVSLHAARNSLRDELVPINQRYPLEMLMQTCRDYLYEKRRRVSFEWAMISTVNDTDRDAHELADLCLQLSPAAHVNLIPLNPTPGWPTIGSSPARVEAFQRLLRSLGVNATIRQNRGTEIDAACGQLAAGQPVTILPKQLR